MPVEVQLHVWIVENIYVDYNKLVDSNFTSVYPVQVFGEFG